jgi:hypothetical protein
LRVRLTSCLVLIQSLARLSARAPHALQKAILLCQSVERIVALAHTPHEATQRIYLGLAGRTAVLVNCCVRQLTLLALFPTGCLQHTLSNANLHAGVVLGLDDAVGSRALAWNVKINEFAA